MRESGDRPSNQVACVSYLDVASFPSIQVMDDLGRIPLRKSLIAPKTPPEFLSLLISPLDDLVILPNAPDIDKIGSQREKPFGTVVGTVRAWILLNHVRYAFLADPFSFRFQHRHEFRVTPLAAPVNVDRRTRLQSEAA